MANFLPEANDAARAGGAYQGAIDYEVFKDDMRYQQQQFFADDMGQQQTPNSQLFQRWYEGSFGNESNPTSHSGYVDSLQKASYETRRAYESTLSDNGFSDYDIAAMRYWDKNVGAAYVSGEAVDPLSFLDAETREVAYQEYVIDENAYATYVGLATQFTEEDYDPNGEGIFNLGDDILQDMQGWGDDKILDFYDNMDLEAKKHAEIAGLDNREDWLKYANDSIGEWKDDHSGFWYNVGQAAQGVGTGFISFFTGIAAIPMQLIGLAGALGSGLTGQGFTFDNALSQSMFKAANDMQAGAVAWADVDENNIFYKIGNVAGYAVGMAAGGAIAKTISAGWAAAGTGGATTTAVSTNVAGGAATAATTATATGAAAQTSALTQAVGTVLTPVKAVSSKVGGAISKVAGKAGSVVTGGASKATGAANALAGTTKIGTAAASGVGKTFNAVKNFVTNSKTIGKISTKMYGNSGLFGTMMASSALGSTVQTVAERGGSVGEAVIRGALSYGVTNALWNKKPAASATATEGIQTGTHSTLDGVLTDGAGKAMEGSISYASNAMVRNQLGAIVDPVQIAKASTKMWTIGTAKQLINESFSEFREGSGIGEILGENASWDAIGNSIMTGAVMSITGQTMKHVAVKIPGTSTHQTFAPKIRYEKTLAGLDKSLTERPDTTTTNKDGTVVVKPSETSALVSQAYQSYKGQAVKSFEQMGVKNPTESMIIEHAYKQMILDNPGYADADSPLTQELLKSGIATFVQEIGSDSVAIKSQVQSSMNAFANKQMSLNDGTLAKETMLFTNMAYMKTMQNGEVGLPEVHDLLLASKSFQHKVVDSLGKKVLGSDQIPAEHSSELEQMFAQSVSEAAQLNANLGQEMSEKFYTHSNAKAVNDIGKMLANPATKDQAIQMAKVLGGVGDKPLAEDIVAEVVENGMTHQEVNNQIANGMHDFVTVSQAFNEIDATIKQGAETIKAGNLGKEELTKVMSEWVVNSHTIPEISKAVDTLTLSQQAEFYNSLDFELRTIKSLEVHGLPIKEYAKKVTSISNDVKAVNNNINQVDNWRTRIEDGDLVEGDKTNIKTSLSTINSAFKRLKEKAMVEYEDLTADEAISKYTNGTVTAASVERINEFGTASIKLYDNKNSTVKTNATVDQYTADIQGLTKEVSSLREQMAETNDTVLKSQLQEQIASLTLENKNTKAKLLELENQIATKEKSDVVVAAKQEVTKKVEAMAYDKPMVGDVVEEAPIVETKTELPSESVEFINTINEQLPTNLNELLSNWHNLSLTKAQSARLDVLWNKHEALRSAIESNENPVILAKDFQKFDVNQKKIKSLVEKIIESNHGGSFKEQYLDTIKEIGSGKNDMSKLIKKNVNDIIKKNDAGDC